MTAPPSLDGDFTHEGTADLVAARLSAIVDSSDDAIVSKDLNGIVQSWNRGAERLFGYSAEEMVGQSIRTIIPRELQDEEDEVLRRIRDGERVDHFETTRRRKDGSLVPISLTVSPVRNGVGRIVGASKIARDITERRAAEEAMRTSLELKDHFLGLVSHELRTPISTIVGNSQLLIRRGDRLSDEARQDVLSDIAAEAERLRRVVEDLLVLVSLDAEGQLAGGPIDLADIAESVVSSEHYRLPHRDISLEIDKEVVPGLGDATLVSLVIQNLIGNAEKYSSSDSLIEVVLTRGAEGGPELQVRDRGIGIEQSELERVFDPFYRSPTASSRAPGMGLGLAVCRRIATALGGSIRAEPRANGGAVFTFSLPPAAGS